MAKTRQKKTRSLADYDRPPVIEVVYGVKFAPLEGWKLPHVGAFWQRVADKFPRSEHAQPVGDLAEIVDNLGLALPRVWLINDADDRLVQLQRGRFLFNWRHRENVGPYPRYKFLSKEFFALFQRFQDFIKEHDLGVLQVQQYDLTYINHVEEQEGWSFPAQLGRVIDHLEWKDRRYKFLPRPSTTTWQAHFPLGQQGGGLTAKLNPARRTRDDKRLLILELSASGLPAESPTERMRDWFSDAHEWIVRGFEDLTTEEAQNQLWGKHE